MSVKIITVLFMLTFFAYCETSFVDNMPKCPLADSTCLADLYETMFRDIGKTGIPEYNIPPFDPAKVNNLSFNVLNLLNITLIDGVVRGIKDCKFKKLRIDIKKGRGCHETICDITIKGHYKADSNSPLVKSFLGVDSIVAEGNGQCSIEQMHLTFDYPFAVQKRSDGEIYLPGSYDQIKYKYEILGATTFKGDGIHVGGQDISKNVIGMMNDNSAYFMKTFGPIFIDKALKEFTFKFIGYFFENVPARHYIIDDLSPYVKT